MSDDFDHLSDEDLLALYNQEVTKRKSGLAAAPSSAPTKIAKQVEYGAANKQLLEDQAAYKRAGPMRAQLDEFDALNTASEPDQNPIQSALDPHGTGGILEQIPWLGEAVARMGGGPKARMTTLSNSMQVNDVPKGQGQVSNFERSLYASGTPSIKNQGPVNKDIVNRKRALFQQEGDRLSFLQAFLQRNQHLNGATQAWDKYVEANPYERGDRQPWDEYFGLKSAKKKQEDKGYPAKKKSSRANDPLGLR